MACPVCFAPIDDAVRTSMNLGIFVLLGVTLVVLGCFGTFFMSLARRARVPAAASAHAGDIDQILVLVHWLGLVSPTDPLSLDRNDPGARDDVTLTNELHLPIGRPAIVYLSSKDVIYSFALPEMRVEQDAVPGLVQRVWFTPTETGQWEIACSQLCGLGRYRMKGSYTIHAQRGYEAWLADNPASAP